MIERMQIANCNRDQILLHYQGKDGAGYRGIHIFYQRMPQEKALEIRLQQERRLVIRRLKQLIVKKAGLYKEANF